MNELKSPSSQSQFRWGGGTGDFDEFFDGKSISHGFRAVGPT